MGRKVRVQRQGGIKQWAGNRDSADKARRKSPGEGDGADEARRQCAWDWDSANRATVPPQVADRAESGGNGGAVGVRKKGTLERSRSALALTSMVVATARP